MQLLWQASLKKCCLRLRVSSDVVILLLATSASSSTQLVNNKGPSRMTDSIVPKTLCSLLQCNIFAGSTTWYAACFHFVVAWRTGFSSLLKATLLLPSQEQQIKTLWQSFIQPQQQPAALCVLVFVLLKHKTQNRQRIGEIFFLLVLINQRDFNLRL